MVATLLTTLAFLAPTPFARGQSPLAVRHRSTDDTATIQVPGLDKPVVVLHISDSHVTVPSGKEADYREHAARMDAAFAKERPHYQTGESALPAVHFRKLTELAKAKKVDAIVLTGDIVNNPSQPSVEYVHQLLAETGVPYLYVSGNHDWHYEGLPGSDNALRETWIERRLRPLYAGRNPLCYAVPIDGINFVAIDDSTYQVDDRQLAFFEQELAKGLPTVLLLHIPVWTEKDAGKSVGSCGDPRWGWDSDGGYQVERRERWSQNGNLKSTTAFVDRVKTAGNLIAVLAGHTHGARSEPLSDSAVQYVARHACDGGCRIVAFEPAGQAAPK
jgi:3',5'-cyclic AMP phosphodiesterase CpdA